MITFGINYSQLRDSSAGMVGLSKHGCDGGLVPPADSTAPGQALRQSSASAERRERPGRATQARRRRHACEGATSRFEELLECTAGRAALVPKRNSR